MTSKGFGRRQAGSFPEGLRKTTKESNDDDLAKIDIMPFVNISLESLL
jgi:hypothetical protein